jgi:hypothetical protein
VAATNTPSRSTSEPGRASPHAVEPTTPDRMTTPGGVRRARASRARSSWWSCPVGAAPRHRAPGTRRRSGSRRRLGRRGRPRGVHRRLVLHGTSRNAPRQLGPFGVALLSGRGAARGTRCVAGGPSRCSPIACTGLSSRLRGPVQRGRRGLSAPSTTHPTRGPRACPPCARAARTPGCRSPR